MSWKSTTPSGFGTAAIAGGVLLLLHGCANRQQAARMPAGPAAPSAVTAVFERQVQNAIDAGDGDIATRSLRERLASNPDDLAARLALASRYALQGAPELAADHYRLAVDRFPDSLEAVNGLANQLEDIGLRGEARVVLTAYVQRSSNPTARTITRLAILFDEGGDFEAGEEYHRRAIALEPAQDAFRNNLGYNFLRRKRFDEAVHEFQAALHLNPGSVVARNNLAWALAGRGGEQDLQDAVLQWQSITGPAAAHSNLAAWWIEQGKYPEARKELNVALGYDSRHPAVLRNLKLVAELDGSAAQGTPEPDLRNRKAKRGGFANFFAKVFGAAPEPSGPSQAQNPSVARNGR